MKHCHKLVSQKKLRAIPAMIHFGWLGFPFSEILLAATTCDGDLSTVPFVFGIIALTIPKIKKYCIYVRIMHTCIVVYVCTYVYIYIWCMHIYTIKPTELVWGKDCFTAGSATGSFQAGHGGRSRGSSRQGDGVMGYGWRSVPFTKGS